MYESIVPWFSTAKLWQFLIYNSFSFHLNTPKTIFNYSVTIEMALCATLFYLAWLRHSHAHIQSYSKIIKSVLSFVVLSIVVLMAMSCAGQLFFPSLCSRHFIKLTACGEPATTGWWRGHPGPASTPFTEGLGTSQDDKYPFSLSEERIRFEMFGRYSGFIFSAIPLWPQKSSFYLMNGGNKNKWVGN